MSGAPVAQAQPSAPMPLAQLYVLPFPETRAFADTVVVLPPRTTRVVVLRHTAEELDIFATLTVSPETFPGPGPVRLRLAQVPGAYGLDISADQPFTGPATIEFFYARHFALPEGARERYPTPTDFERAASVAQQISETQAVLLPTSRPALDHAAAAVSASARYMVAAPQ